MKLSLMVCVVALAFGAGAAVGQLFPVRLYGGGMDERAYALTEGVDDGFCLAGWTRSFGPGTPIASNVVVVKTDALGNPVWVRLSVGESDDEAYSMVRVPDGYVVTGWTRSYGSGMKDIFVVKLDPAGNVVWSRVYGGPMDEEALSIASCSDGGYVVTGWTASYGPAPWPNLFVLRLGPSGFVVWSRVYWGLPMHVEDEGHSIVQTPDSGFAVCGRLKATSPAQWDAFLAKLSPAGALQWAWIVPGGDTDVAWSVDVDFLGRILVAGYTRSYGTAPGVFTDLFAAAFTVGGAPVWAFTYGSPIGDEEMLDDRSLTRTIDGGSVLSGSTTSYGVGLPNPNMLIVKLDPAGMPMWASSHPSPYWPGLMTDVALPIIERTGVGGYAVAGYSNSFGLLGGGDDMTLSTFDMMGLRPVCAHPEMVNIAEPQLTQWGFADSLVRPELDSMPLFDATVLYDSVCYDTTHTGVKEGFKGSRGQGFEGVGLRTRGSRVELVLGRTASVKVSLFTSDGRAVGQLARGEWSEGRHEVTLPGNLAAGSYIVRAEALGRSATVKVVRY